MNILSAKHLIITFLSTFLVAGCYQRALAQSGESGNDLGIVSTNTFPKEILYTKSAVLISAPKGEWKKMAAVLQPFLAEQGIDAIAYFSLEEILSGKAVQLSLAASLKRRGVKNLVTLSVSENEPTYLMTIGDFKGEWNFYPKGSKRWVRRSSDLSVILEEIALLFKQGNYRRENMLILDQPEFFELGGVVEEKRVERYFSWLKTQKLAIPKIPDVEANVNSIEKLALHNEDLSHTGFLNDKLEEMLQAYPFPWGFVDAQNLSETEIARQGYTFMLYSLEGSEKFVKSLLQYQDAGQSGDDYVIKYYVKHLSNKNIYLGKTWDASPSKKEAFISFIESVKAELDTSDNSPD